MEQHEMEITISKTGEIKVHIKGAKGKRCLQYAEWLKQVVGKIKDQKLTSEYYEPEVKSRINLDVDLKTDSDQQ